jgi:hypothetical protein
MDSSVANISVQKCKQRATDRKYSICLVTQLNVMMNIHTCSLIGISSLS